MRRGAVAAALSLMLVTLVGGTASAHNGGGHQPLPSFSAGAGSADQGGRLWVRARVQHAVPDTAFSASAVVHFVSGNVTVTLEPRGERWAHRGHHHGLQFHHRRGHVLVARTWVPVGPAETPGEVLVDVTIVYGTQTVVIHTTGFIEGTVLPPDPGDGGPIQIG